MPRRNNKRGASSLDPKITRESFRVITLSAANTTTMNRFTQYNLILPNLGDRGAFIGENFEFFRIVALRVESIVDSAPVTNGATGGAIAHAVSFMNTPFGSQTTPTTNGLMSQQEHYHLANGFSKAVINVRRSDLLAEPLKWFNTFSTGSVPASTQSAGVVTGGLFTAYSATTSPGTTQYILISGIVEFHTPIDSADSLRRRIPRAIRSLPAVQRALDRFDQAVEDAVVTTTDAAC